MELKIFYNFTNHLIMVEHENKLSTDFAKYFDHTLLKPDAKESEIKKLCQEAIDNKFASVCVNIYYADLVKKLLKGNENVKLCVVVGFPLGATTKEVKAFETREAIKKGADEIDMVLNIGALKNKNYEDVKDDIKAVVEASKADSGQKALVKVIIETCLLTDEEKRIACSLAKECNADFIKTYTGFSKSGATAADIKLMKEIAGNQMKVKASGGIRTKKDLEEMILAGADRIGASASVNIIKEFDH